MSENNRKSPPVELLKKAAFDMFAFLRRSLTPDLGKRAAVCLFMLLLLLGECISCFVSNPNTDSFMNPFIQGMWLYLALFGISIIPGGTATRILLSFWLAFMSMVAATGIFLHLRFALDIDCDCFFVLAASSTGEIREFLFHFLTWQMVLITLAVLAVGGGMIALVWRTKYRRSLANTAVALLLILPFVINCIRYAAGNELDRIYSRSNLPRLVSGYFIYHGKFSKLLELEKNPQLPSGIRQLSGGENMIGVLVIGESANCNHWGAYGYPRDTTPEIAKRRDSCLIYDDVVAALPHTTGALYYILTDALLDGAAERKQARFTLVDVFKAAGWRVVLVSNQERWGKHDGPIGIFTAHCDRRIYLHENADTRKTFDADVVAEVQKELRKADGGRLLIIAHLMGSHQDFLARYPREFARFDGVRDECNAGMREKHARELNEYDNSIAYTDVVLGGILKELEGYVRRPVFMLYCSDHSEIGDWNEHLHARSAASVAPDVYEVPCVLWTNGEYRRKFPQFIERATRNLHAPLQTDRLTWSILSAARIRFDGFPDQEDIFAGERFVPAKRRLMGDATYGPSESKRKLWGSTRGGNNENPMTNQSPNKE